MTKAQINEAKKRHAETKESYLAEKRKHERKVSRIMRNSRKLTAIELYEFRTAAETYADKLKEFTRGRKVTGKGKAKRVQVFPHKPEPSFKVILEEITKKRPVGA